MQIIQIGKEMTGGGCMTYWGLLQDGRYFVYGLNVFMFADADYGYTFTEKFFNETGGDTYEWEKKHATKIYYNSSEYTAEVNEIISEL